MFHRIKISERFEKKVRCLFLGPVFHSHVFRSCFRATPPNTVQYSSCPQIDQLNYRKTMKKYKL